MVCLRSQVLPLAVAALAVAYQIVKTMPKLTLTKQDSASLHSLLSRTAQAHTLCP